MVIKNISLIENVQLARNMCDKLGIPCVVCLSPLSGGVAAHFAYQRAEAKQLAQALWAAAANSHGHRRLFFNFSGKHSDICQISHKPLA